MMNAAAHVDTQREEYGSGAWVPQVGDRVISSDAAAKGETGVVVKAENDHGYILVKFDTWRRGHDGVKIIGDVGKDHWFVSPFNLSPAPAAACATIRIEAGKFYRTRDGRKVGPIYTAQGPGSPWPWKAYTGLTYYYFKEDGYSCPGSARDHRDSDDIISEWVDEPQASNDNEAPAKFKVGDRVRALESSAFSVKKGVVYTVTEDCGDGRIRFQKPDGSIDGWDARFFELSAPAIVCLIENGQPKPSTFPHVHADEHSASAEASRLAGVHKGKHFGVYVLAQTVSEERPAYKHEWQRLAIEGQKIAAIKELRALTGMQLKPAKDVVEHFIYSPYGLAA